MIDAHRKAFIEEATELLAELESTLLELEESPDNNELIARVFRALHTIKGSAGMFGYDDITMFTHDIENVYDHIRNGVIKINKEIIDLTLAAKDQIGILLNNSQGKGEVNEKIVNDIILSFGQIIAKFNLNKGDKEKEIKKTSAGTDNNIQGKPETYYIKFKPSEDIFLTGTNPVMLLNELRDLGKSFILGNFKELPLFEYLNHEKCYACWEIILKTDKGLNAIKDVFIFVEDNCELKIETIDKESKLDGEEDFKDFKELVFAVAKTKKPDILNLLSEFETSAQQIKTAPVKNNDDKKIKNNIEVHHENDSLSSIRVSAEKLDELVNLVGELVTAQARLNQIAFNSTDTNIISLSEEIERITWSLRDSALNIRMLPIGTTFSKFKRLVRDLSKELGKEVELTTAGAETELDKTVIEKLNDPLIHIIRNSIDHGIENPEERLQKGKSSTGTVHLSASQSGGNVLIKISDDGKGMNKEKIKAKAIRQGLIADNSDPSDSELLSLIFAAGFSTAEKVTNVSGRGVGMDVVKRAIEALRGTVEISSSGSGTTITLRLPLTLAIIDGLLVKIDEDSFVLPLSSVEECIELTENDIKRTHGRNIINVRGGIIPYINLRSKFEIKSKPPSIQQIAIAKINNGKVGFVVDQVIGQHQTVLKSLGGYYKNVEGISGATIMGDGAVALILDIKKILENEETEIVK